MPPSENSRVLVIIPTHNHPTTLPFAIRSAQAQTISDIRIVIIGDGVTDETRQAVKSFIETDGRVEFIDRVKGVRHGEQYRDELIQNSSEEFVAYLGDDDLMFPNHLKMLIETLGERDFANTLPTFIKSNGEIFALPIDLEHDGSLEWHLEKNRQQNSVSLTGVIHTKSSYQRLPFRWRPAPLGEFTDHYMWKQYFELPYFTAKTSHVSTVAKFHSSERVGMSAENRKDEIEKFWNHMQVPGFQDEWNRRVDKALFETGNNFVLDHARQQGHIEILGQQLIEIEENIKAQQEAVTSLSQENAVLMGEIQAIKSSIIFRILKAITRPIDKVRRFFR